MATLTNEQIEAKKQQLKQLTEEVNALSKELVEAGAIEMSDDDLDAVSGGDTPLSPVEWVRQNPKRMEEFFKRMREIGLIGPEKKST